MGSEGRDLDDGTEERAEKGGASRVNDTFGALNEERSKEQETHPMIMIDDPRNIIRRRPSLSPP